VSGQIARDARHEHAKADPLHGLSIDRDPRARFERALLRSRRGIPGRLRSNGLYWSGTRGWARFAPRGRRARKLDDANASHLLLGRLRRPRLRSPIATRPGQAGDERQHRER